MQSTTKYNYTSFFLLFIAFASAFNYYLTYRGIKFDLRLALTYTIDTVEGWLAWFAMHQIIIYLDRKLPYDDKPIRRIAVQTAVTTLAGLSIIILLTELVSYVRKGRSASIDFYTLDIFIVIIWFLVLNGIYIGIHFYHETELSETRRRQDKKIKSTGFFVKQGRQDLQIPFDSIICFYSDDGFTYLFSADDKTYLSERSLDKIDQFIPEELFFRLNRKFIFHRHAISGFKRVGDGKLEVRVRSSAKNPDTIAVSRIRAVDFKKWIRLEES